MKVVYPEGATPIDPDEMIGLIPPHVVVQQELNEWEQENILKAECWVRNQKFFIEKILDFIFLKRLHIEMFGQTWRWAGQYRTTDKNIGVAWQKINTQLKLLFDDVNYQLSHHVYDADEICARFHHRLVWIHPFVNGNGRHARLMADVLLIALKQPRFTWGSRSLIAIGEVRAQYMKALRAADRGDYTLLLRFVRS
ncbi:MAG: mobile mystery protein B [Pseudomonadota bacterium]